MTIEQIDSSKVLITLCSQDMKDYRLDFNAMGFSNPHSKKILNRLIKIVCTKTGLSTENKKLLMEALPHQSGCLILVTFIEKRPLQTKYKIKKFGENICFSFENTENFMAAVSLLYKENLRFHSNKAYLFNGAYYFIFEHYPLPLKAKRILNEFGKRKKCTKAFLSAIKEAGKPICEKNAVSVMGKAFSK
ncbi:MAG: adaptor protein MecA [Oscillospiraceae bacterium]|nr:adaptor protein MecA [Oscillospiraceae bacterium]